jgi:uncharacterized cofD-like protein
MTNIVTIGGGAGTFNVLYGLKRNLEYNISAIISVADNGGTTGAIRDKYGILPPGDMRRAIAALAGNTEMVRKLFEYSFQGEEWVIGSNKIGNILLTALVDICGGDYEKALEVMGEMFDVRGRVIPVTLEDVHLGVKFEDGTIVIGEKNIDISDKNPGARSHNIDQNIVEAWLEGARWTLNPNAKKAIENADYIIIGPWDLYTSIVPNLLSLGMREALDQTGAQIIYIVNAMTKRGETTNMEVIDFIDTIERYIDPGKLDYVIVNDGVISDEIIAKYKAEENKKPLQIKDHSLFEGKSYRVIERDLVHTAGDYIRHDPDALEKTLEDIVGGRIR